MWYDMGRRMNFPSAIDNQLAALRRRRTQIDLEIRVLLGLVGHVIRPTWGPCTRCGYVWEGLYPDRPPRACARCHSTGWQVMPLLPTARTPSDPPHPNWRKSRRSARLNTDEAKVERATKLAGVAPNTKLETVEGLTPPPPLMSEQLEGGGVNDADAANAAAELPAGDAHPPEQHADVASYLREGERIMSERPSEDGRPLSETHFENISAPDDVQSPPAGVEAVDASAGVDVVDNPDPPAPPDTVPVDSEPVSAEGTLVIEDLSE